MERPSTASDRPRRRLVHGLVHGLVLVLAVAHVWIASHAGHRKSITTDEPLHALGGFVKWHLGDHRFNPEDPPLLFSIVGGLQPRDALALDTDDPRWRAIPKNVENQWPWFYRTLIDADRADLPGFLAPMRAWMPAVGALLVIATAYTARAMLRLGRARRGWRDGLTLVAAAVIALDPNLLGHAPLVKNDVANALAWTMAVAALWRVGTRASAGWVGALGVAAGVAAATKFTGVLIGPAVAMALFGRALLPMPWRVVGRTLMTRRSRLLGATGVGIVAAIVAWAIVWASYGFRYAAIPGEATPLNLEILANKAGVYQQYLDAGRILEEHELGPVERPTISRVILAVDRARLLPESYSFGLLFVQTHSMARQSYLMGEFSLDGFTAYFPVAMLVKTPTGTLLLWGIGLLLLARAVARRERLDLWTLVALLVPGAFYLVMAMGSNLNLGLRHVFPLFPLLTIGCVLAVGQSVVRRESGRRVARWIGAAVLLLAIESLARHPHYIAFFNLPSGGPERGAAWLLDSNLDWGQDLKLLAEWQREHPEVELHLSYFGGIDPRSYGIDYVPSLPPWVYATQAGQQPTWPPPESTPGRPVVLAISVNNLYGLYHEPFREFFAPLRQSEPREILGHTIYLYDWPPATTSNPK